MPAFFYWTITSTFWILLCGSVFSIGGTHATFDHRLTFFVDESPVDLIKMNLSNYYIVLTTRLLSFSGLYARFLLSPVLDWPTTGVCEEAWCGDAVCGCRVHQEHLGAGHFLCEREAVVFPQRHHQQRVHSRTPLRQHHSQHEVCAVCINDHQLKKKKMN